MNSRERFLGTMRFQPVDRAPDVEFGLWGQTIERWLREGMPADVDPTFSVLRGNEFFGFDRWGTIGIRFGMCPEFDEVTLHEDDEIIVYVSREGITRKAMKAGTVRGTRPSMDEFMDFPVKTRPDFQEIKRRYNPHSPARYPQWWADQVRCSIGRDYPLCLLGKGDFGLYSQIRRWMGTEAACLIFYDDPALAEEMLDFIVDYFIEVTHRALDDVDVDYFNWWEDFAGKAGPLVSPAIFRQFLLPRYRRVADFLHAHGVDIIGIDSDGNINALIPLLIEAGVNCIYPIEVAAGMDALQVRRQYGKDLALWGGIDKRELARGRQAIEQELYRQVPALLEQGGYIPYVDHSVPPDVSYADFQYYLEVKRRILEGR